MRHRILNQRVVILTRQAPAMEWSRMKDRMRVIYPISKSADGTVEDAFLAEHVTLESGKENSLLPEGGTALVIHAEADDGKTQPSGDSGNRIACGIVK